ncbi:MAG: DNA-binding protein WhiA [Candidatus Tyrphobacter sp.]
MNALGPDTKDALAREPAGDRRARDAFAHALAFYGADAAGAAFVTHRNSVARLFWSLLDDRKSAAIAATPGKRLARLARFSIALPQGLSVEPAQSARRGDRHLELRAAFLAFGTISVNASGYHLEFAPPDARRHERLRRLVAALDLPMRSSRRRGRPLVYMKDFDRIVDALARIGAHEAVLALEDVRALRETKNRIHRLVNTETANLARSARAAAIQRRTIAYVDRVRGLARLPRPLREIASLRIRYPGDSLAELGRRCNPPVGKPTVGSRLRALSRIAARLRSAQQGEPVAGR